MEAIEYVPKRLMRDLKNNPFTGEPNDEPTEEFDRAWAHLLERRFYAAYSSGKT